MLIYLLRHGETDYNAENRYQGIRDIPLSDQGRRRLRRADFSPDTVYVSPLIRAVETAKIIFPNAALIPVTDLREMDFGDFEGRNYIEMADDPAYRAWVDGYCLDRCPNSTEDRAMFMERTCAAFSTLVDTALRENTPQLVIMAHGGTQMAVMARFARPQKDFYDWHVGNAAGFVLETTPWNKDRKVDFLKEISFSCSSM